MTPTPTTTQEYNHNFVFGRATFRRTHIWVWQPDGYGVYRARFLCPDEVENTSDFTLEQLCEGIKH